MRTFTEAGIQGFRDREARKRHALLNERFWERVDQSAGPEACWPWTGLRQTLVPGGGGYGYLSILGKTYYAHRRALELKLGRPLAPRMEAMHSCDNPPCCNPAHLTEATHAENFADMARKGRWWSEKRLAYLRRRKETAA